MCTGACTYLKGLKTAFVIVEFDTGEEMEGGSMHVLFLQPSFNEAIGNRFL